MTRSCLLAGFTLAGIVSLSAMSMDAQFVPPPPPDAFESIVHQPATQSTFTLDRSMLAAADGLFNGQDAEGRTIAAGLNSITVHNYRYRDYASYDQGAFAAVDSGYRAAGYQHLVNANARGSGNLTDLWLRFQGANVNSVVVLTRGDRTMTALVVDCTLRPLDLFRLSGHFGIPKVDQGAVMVPANPGGAPPYGPYGNGPNSNGRVAGGPYPNASAPNGPYTTAPGSAPPPPQQNPPELKRHSPDDPQ